MGHEKPYITQSSEHCTHLGFLGIYVIKRMTNAPLELSVVGPSGLYLVFCLIIQTSLVPLKILKFLMVAFKDLSTHGNFCGNQSPQDFMCTARHLQFNCSRLYSRQKKLYRQLYTQSLTCVLDFCGVDPDPKLI